MLFSEFDTKFDMNFNNDYNSDSFEELDSYIEEEIRDYTDKEIRDIEYYALGLHVIVIYKVYQLQVAI